MYVLVQILRCGSGRQKEALKRLHWIHGLMAERDDCGGCIVAKHLGNPVDLLILRFWETEEAMARRTNAYYQDRWPLFPPNEPEGIYQTQNIDHHWREVLTTGGRAEGGFIWRRTYRVATEKWPEFLALREQEDARMTESGGLVWVRTFRGTENEELALVLVRLAGRGHLDRISIEPERAAIETSLIGLTRPLDYPDLDVFASECFGIVDEYPAKSASV